MRPQPPKGRWNIERWVQNGGEAGGEENAELILGEVNDEQGSAWGVLGVMASTSRLMLCL